MKVNADVTKNLGQEATNTIMSYINDLKEEKPVFVCAGYMEDMGVHFLK